MRASLRLDEPFVPIRLAPPEPRQFPVTAPAAAPLSGVRPRRPASRQHRHSSTFATFDLRGTGYPYVLLFADIAGIKPDDQYTLSSVDGSYCATLSAREGERVAGGHIVLWFPLPPRESRCHLYYEPAPDDSGSSAEAYFIFRNQPATYRCSPQAHTPASGAARPDETQPDLGSPSA